MLVFVCTLVYFIGKYEGLLLMLFMWYILFY